jgi:hypothetical protein
LEERCAKGIECNKTKAKEVKSGLFSAKIMKQYTNDITTDTKLTL